jgi:iron complex outermembrane receptor protein
MAIFSAKYKDLQLDFLTPEIQTETINAINPAKVKGVELEAVAAVTDNLRLNLNYSFLNGDLPPQPNTTAPGSPLTLFRLPETPRHAGSLSANYTVATLPIGELNLYGEVTSRSNLYLTTGADRRTGGYTLLNARASLAKVQFGDMAGKLEISLWGYNLANRLYNAVQFSSPPTLIMGQNEPRTYGIDLRYEY